MWKIAIVAIAVAGLGVSQAARPPAKAPVKPRTSGQRRTAPAPKPAPKPDPPPATAETPPVTAVQPPSPSSMLLTNAPPPSSQQDDRPGTDPWLIGFAGVLAAVGVLQWLTMWRQSRHMREELTLTRQAADAAATGAATAAKALGVSERAYVVIRNWAMRVPSVGDVPEAEFVVENTGHTPANRTLVRGRIEVRDAALPAVPDWRANEPSGGQLTIAPGGRPLSTLRGDHPLTREEVDRLRANKVFLSIWGRVDYVDAFGVAQSVSFARRLNMSTGELLYDAASDAYHDAS
jgi:hypothetical protein